MKCFIHEDREAIAVCKDCGKAMCRNCSAFTNHSGLCPECRLAELKDKLHRGVASFFIFTGLTVAAIFGMIDNWLNLKSIFLVTIIVCAIIAIAALICTIPISRAVNKLESALDGEEKELYK